MTTPKKPTEPQAPSQNEAVSPTGSDLQNALKPGRAYEKPRLRIYAPLQDLTFTTVAGATGSGIVTSVSGGGI